MKKEELENTRLKYQMTLNLFSSEGQIQWNRYNAMLAVNVIILGLSSFNSTSFPITLQLLYRFSPIFGLILCHLWYRMTARGFMWMNHWIIEASKLESQLEGQIKPLQNGRELRSKTGSKVTENASLLIIKIIAFLYFVMALITIGPWVTTLK